jgi:hypothetical protein
MSRIMTDDAELNRLINEISPNTEIVSSGINMKSRIEESMKNYQRSAVKFKGEQKKKFDEIKTKLDVFKKWDPFVKGTERIFSFDENDKGNNTDEKRLKDIYKEGNSNNDKKTFNGKNIFL